MRSNANTNERRSSVDGFCILPWGYTHKIEERRKNSRKLSETLENLLNNLPDDILVKSELSNMCGATPATASPLITGEREVLKISYIFKESEAEAQDEVGAFIISSRFARFEGNKSIVFKVQRSDSFGASNPRELLLDERIDLTEIAVSIERYERRWASLFGLFPVVTQTVKFVANERESAIEASVQRQASKDIAQERGQLLLAPFLEILED